MIRRTFFSTLLAPLLARFAPQAKAEAPALNTTGWADAYIEDGHLFYDMDDPTWRDMGLVPAGDPKANLRFHRDCFAIVYPPLGTQDPTMQFDPPIVPSCALEGRLDVRYVNGRIISTWRPPEEQK